MAFPTGAKILVSLLAFIVAVVLLVGTGAYVYVHRNRDRLVADARKASADGAAFGKSHSKEQCEVEALDRVGSCGIGRLVCEGEVKRFYKACLEASAPSPNVCDGVPPMSALVPSIQWVSKRCALRGKSGSSPCIRIVQTLQEHCEQTR